MKYTNLKQLNILIWVTIALLSLNSCKKDDPQPLKSAQVVPQTIITHYHRDYIPGGCSEARDIYIYDNDGVLTMSDPYYTAYPDTMIFNSNMNFKQIHNVLGWEIAGHIEFVNNNLVLTFLQMKYTPASLNPDCKQYNLEYIKVP